MPTSRSYSEQISHNNEKWMNDRFRPPFFVFVSFRIFVPPLFLLVPISVPILVPDFGSGFLDPNFRSGFRIWISDSDFFSDFGSRFRFQISVPDFGSGFRFRISDPDSGFWFRISVTDFGSRFFPVPFRFWIRFQIQFQIWFTIRFFLIQFFRIRFFRIHFFKSNFGSDSLISLSYSMPIFCANSFGLF